MRYNYFCSKCDTVFSLEYPFGKAPRTVACEKCKNLSERYIDGVNFILKGTSGFPSKALKMKNEQTAKNERAGKKMRKTWANSIKRVDN